MKFRFALTLCAALFVGCGDTNSTTPSEPSSSDDASSASSEDQVITAVGYYVDSAVSGIHYVCGGQSGETGENGEFTFEVGEGCIFSLNNIQLREVVSSELHSQVKIQEDNVEVARLLQSLDNDGDPENGITISTEVVNALAVQNIQGIPADDTEVASLVQLIKTAVSTYQGSAKTAEEAQLHLDRLAVEINVEKREIVAGESITLDASVRDTSTGTLTYSWKEAGVILGDTSTLTLDDLSVGDHTITLTVLNSENISKTVSIVITVSESAPIVVTMMLSKPSLTGSEQVTFTANVQDSSDDLTYTWIDTKNIWTSLGDPDKPQSWTEENTTLDTLSTNTFTTALTEGRHVISLKVTDANGHETYAKSAYNENANTLGVWVNFKTEARNETDNILIDTVSGLTWINDTDVCKVFNEADKIQQFEENKAYCANLNFAGYDDWRIGTTAEVSDFIKRTFEGNILPEYFSTACAYMVGDNEDGSYAQIYTGYGAQKYDAIAGDLFSQTLQNYNFGMRCVRETDGSGATVDMPTENNTSTTDNNTTTGDTPPGTVDTNTSSSSSSSSSSSAVASSFTQIYLTDEGHGVMTDSATGKMWVSETAETNHGGCMAIHNDEEYETGKSFCENLAFAGFSDWRTPDVSEMEDFILRTIDEEILPGYLAPCKTLLAKDDNDGNYVAIVTRYGDAEINRTAGDVEEVAYNIGLRCVRDMQ